MQDGQTALCKWAKVTGTSKPQSNQSEGTGGGWNGGVTLFELPDFAVLSQPGNVGVGESSSPGKKGPDSFSPEASFPPVYKSQVTGRAAPAKTWAAGSVERRSRPGTESL